MRRGRILRQSEPVGETDAKTVEIPLQKGTVVRQRFVGYERSSVDDDTVGRGVLFSDGAAVSNEAKGDEQCCGHRESDGGLTVHRSAPVIMIPWTVRRTVEPEGDSFPQQSTAPRLPAEGVGREVEERAHGFPFKGDVHGRDRSAC